MQVYIDFNLPVCMYACMDGRTDGWMGVGMNEDVVKCARKQLSN